MSRDGSSGKRGRTKPGAIARGLIATLALLYGSTARSQTEATALLTDPISPQPIAQALDNLTRQSGLQYVCRSDLIQGQRTHGAPAGIPARDAVVLLLTDTGLGFQFLNERTIVILPGRSAQAPIEEVLIVAVRFVPRAPPVAAASAAELRRLKAADEEIERLISRRRLLYEDADLEIYLQGIVRRLLATDGTNGDAVHVRVIRGTEPSAFALSDGSIYMTTALLASLNSEAEIAAIIGHELTHYTNAHLLRGLRAGSVAAATGWSAGMLFGFMIVLAERHAGTAPTAHLQLSEDTLKVWARAAVTGYPEELEREADNAAVRRMLAAGYDASGAVAALQHLHEQIPAEHQRLAGTEPIAAIHSGLPLGGQRSAVPPLYASAPHLTRRSVSYRALLAGSLAGAVGAGHELGRTEYAAHVARLRLDQAEILLQAGALDRADAALDTATVGGDTGRAEYLRGQIAGHRDPSIEANTTGALAAYSRALEFAEAPAEVYREQGYLYWREQDFSHARAAFESYLARAPQAADAPLVRWYLDQRPADSPSAAVDVTKPSPP
jgi:beta-barrel assembly-enhancing protease